MDLLFPTFFIPTRTSFPLFQLLSGSVQAKDANQFRCRKLVIIGDGACGKTSLLSVFTLGYFPTRYVCIDPSALSAFILFSHFHFTRDLVVHCLIYTIRRSIPYLTVHNVLRTTNNRTPGSNRL
jgi:GTPase SAR1 family protein